MKRSSGRIARADAAAPFLLLVALTAAAGILILAAVGLDAAVLNVPSDHPTIALAVSRASDGDTVLVDDGVYLESGIEVTKDIVARSRNPFGAVVYGTGGSADAIFIVKARARIEGFVLKGAARGIVQRGSPDVEWEASRLAIIECGIGISINDASGNVGSARVLNVAIVGGPGSVGLETNDAARLEAVDCLIAGCEIAYQGYDHLSFRVSRGAVLDCGRAVEETTIYRPVPPATSRIEVDAALRVVSADELRKPGKLQEFLAYLGTAVLDAGGRTGRDASGGGADGDPAARALLALIEGGIRLRQGLPGDAAAGFGKALEAARMAGSKELSWQAQKGMAEAAAKRGDTREAISRSREAIGHLEEWAPSVPTGLYRIGFLADKIRAFEALIGLLFAEHEADPRGGWDGLAFEYSEKRRALTRLSELGAKGFGEDAGRACREISALQRQLQDPDLAGEAKEALVRSLERAERDYHGALVAEERAAMRSGRTAERANRRDGGAASSPPSLGSVTDRLNGRAVLSYVLGDKDSFGFLVTATDLEFVRLPAAARIAGLVEPYLQFLQLEDERDSFSGAKAGRLLFDLLVGPFAAKLRSGPRRIIVVPDGRLRYLPFEALVASGGEEGGRAVFWAESVAISYAESAAAALHGRPWRASGGWMRASGPAILAVGCSDGIRCDNRSRQLKRFFKPLAYVRREIGALERLFKGRPVTTLIDEEASEARFKALDLARFGVVHLAAHGVIDDADWWRSALLLRPGAESGEDGFLTALEISRLEIGRSLVVLSGCGTGAGRLHEGEGILGLSEAFRRAGAGPLVVSLWSVDDRATAMLMERFYRGLAAGAPAAEALAGAKREMIKAGRGDPFHWASFVLIGSAADPSSKPGEAGRGAASIR